MTDTASRPVEAKPLAATGGAGAGVVLAGLVLYLLDRWFGPVAAPIEAGVALLVPMGLALAGGWWAKHTKRPDLEGATDLQAMARELGPVLAPLVAAQVQQALRGTSWQGEPKPPQA